MSGYTYEIFTTPKTATAVVTCHANGRTERRRFQCRWFTPRIQAEAWARCRIEEYEESQKQVREQDGPA